MNRWKILAYELRRLFLSPTYLLLLVATLLYSWSLLRGVVIFGVNYTAPFSPWTFCTYLAALSPLLLLLLLALCRRQLSEADHGAAAIMEAAPMPVLVQRSLRLTAVLISYLTAAGLAVAACCTFYWLTFDFTSFSQLLSSALLMLLPPAILLLGLALRLGARHPVAINMLLAAVILLGMFRLPLPAWLDVTGSSAILPTAGQQPFAFAAAFLAGRTCFLVIGLACLAFSLAPNKVANKTVRDR